MLLQAPSMDKVRLEMAQNEALGIDADIEPPQMSTVSASSTTMVIMGIELEDLQ